MYATQQGYVASQLVGQQNFRPHHVEILRLPAVELSQTRIPPGLVPVESFVTKVNRRREDPSRFSIRLAERRFTPGPRPIDQQFHSAWMSGIPGEHRHRAHRAATIQHIKRLIVPGTDLGRTEHH